MDGAKTRTKRRFLKTRPDARTEAQTRTCPGKPGRMVTLYLPTVSEVDSAERSVEHVLR